MTERQARDRVYRARAARTRHAEECVLWDYESDGGCEECARCDRELAEVLRRHGAFHPRAGGL